ncbi:hypothetical protein L2D08_05075 [Domibacillus sp. PGB-M46]|uniref:hypothetical protein n=1 Tax=Domibacillus sp. PGB-M46 TaxID=2910255 RepID=UPI001F582184|nr:hypothetical protein [Domibacillus sp. PGB-M46]MCI2253732.1 hypothetical protein [Domibacillus sp. PGB-M46]
MIWITVHMNGWIGGVRAAPLSMGQALSPIGVCAALPPPSGLRQDCIELKRSYLSVLIDVQ